MTRLRYAATGFLLGAVWGVVGRGWMRLISTDPTFSWSGTLLLIGMAALTGLALGLVGAARARGGSRWWLLLSLLLPWFFSGAGLPLLPGVLVAGWGLRRGVWGRLLAVVAIVSAPAILLAATWEDIDRWLGPYPDNVFRAVIAGGSLVLTAAAAWGTSFALGPWRSRRQRRVTSEDSALPVSA